MIRQRVNAGLKRTVAQGKQFGRPRIDAALEKRIQAQLRTGKGMLKVACECGVGSGTVQRIRQEMEGPFVGEADGAQMKLKRPSTRCPLCAATVALWALSYGPNLRHCPGTHQAD